MTRADRSRHVSALWRWPNFRLSLLVLMLTCGVMPALAASPSIQDGQTDTLFRIAFSTRMFTDVKIEDARAAMKVWLIKVMREGSIPVDPEMKTFDRLEDMLRGARDTQIEGFGVTTEEYWRLSKEIKFDRLVVATNKGRITEEYVILVHRSSTIESIADLHGHSLTVLEHPRMSLGIIWLDTHLLRKGMNRSAKLFNRVTYVNKLSQAVLPVFFRKSDACLVTRRGFQTMSELNPQVEKQLRVLVASPELVPSVFALRADHVSPHREKMLAEMERLAESPPGQQILTLLQTERVEEQPISCLSATLALLAAHHQLCSAPGNPGH